MIRTLLLLIILLLPLSAGADEASSLLGPSSNSASSALQPANPGDSNALQSSPTSNGVTQAPNGNNLQQPASQEQAELFIQGDIDTSEPDNEGVPGWIWVFGLIGVVALALGIVAARMGRRQQARSVVSAAVSTPESKRIKKPKSKAKKRKRKTR